MPSTRILPLAAIVVGALALSGCIVSPPAIAPQQTAPTTTPADPTPTPEASDPAPSSAPAPSSTPAPSDASPAPSGASVSIDGQDVGTWGTTITCLGYGDGAVVTSDSGDESGTLVGGADLVDGAWTVTGFLVSNGEAVYYQTDETAPATFEGGVLSASFGVTDFTGGTATLAFTVPC